MNMTLQSFFRDPQYLKWYVTSDLQVISPEVADTVLSSRVNIFKVCIILQISHDHHL